MLVGLGGKQASREETMEEPNGKWKADGVRREEWKNEE